MKRTLLILLAVLVGLQLGGKLPVKAADEAAAPPPSAAPQLGAAELEKLVMPIALHPDPLIATLLPASVYPLEIVQAARFVKDTNNVAKVDEQPWDDTVKAVAKIPALIAQLDADLEWTMKLGQAFLNQPKELMDAIQDLRAKANKAGTLRTTPQQVVVVTNVVVMQTNVTQVVNVTNQIVQVQSSSPDVVYVPSYPPTVYYPPPAYVYDPYAPLITFGVGMAMGAIIANNCDWHGGGVWCGGGNDVNIDIDRNTNINTGDRNRGQGGNRPSSTGAKAGQQKWQPNQSRLNSSGAPSVSSQAARGYGSGSGGAGARPTTGAAGAGARPSTAARPSTGAASPAARPSTGAASPAARPSTGAASAGARPSTGNNYPGGGGAASGGRSTPSPSVSPSSSGAGGSAFGGVNSGSSSRDSSNRGSSSRSGGGGFSGGGGRGGGGRGGGGRR